MYSSSAGCGAAEGKGAERRVAIEDARVGSMDMKEEVRREGRLGDEEWG